jgi:hypothetical protein
VSAARDRYQALLDRAFPLTEAMRLELTRLDAGHAATHMPLARTHNVHGTAYLEPVTGDPLCRCAIDAAELERFCQELTRTGKARITAEVEIGDGATPAAVLISGFSARLKD